VYFMRNLVLSSQLRLDSPNTFFTQIFRLDCNHFSYLPCVLHGVCTNLKMLKHNKFCYNQSLVQKLLTIWISVVTLCTTFCHTHELYIVPTVYLSIMWFSKQTSEVSLNSAIWLDLISKEVFALCEVGIRMSWSSKSYWIVQKGL
jgi:hypothetical protein